MSYRCLILGQSGYIGTNLSRKLGELGYELDFMSKAEFMSEDWKRIKHWQGDEELDHPDVLINCAWTRADLQSTEHFEFAEMVCQMYRKCKDIGVRVINLGSSSEYGDPGEEMMEDMACFPINAYGIGKLQVTLYAKLLGFNTLRLFTIYGGNPKGHSFRDLWEKTGKWSDRNASRDYVVIDDLLRAVEQIVHAEHLYGEIINICGGEESLNSELVDNLGKFGSYPITQFEKAHWVGDENKMNSLGIFTNGTNAEPAKD